LPPEDSASPISVLKNLISTAEAPVILGCTDLSVAYGPDRETRQGVIVDSLETLADAIIKESINISGIKK
jgi:aspartate/glutamate racemase